MVNFNLHKYCLTSQANSFEFLHKSFRSIIIFFFNNANYIPHNLVVLVVFFINLCVTNNFPPLLQTIYTFLKIYCIQTSSTLQQSNDTTLVHFDLKLFSLKVGSSTTKSQRLFQNILPPLGFVYFKGNLFRKIIIYVPVPSRTVVIFIINFPNFQMNTQSQHKQKEIETVLTRKRNKCP